MNSDEDSPVTDGDRGIPAFPAEPKRKTGVRLAIYGTGIVGVLIAAGGCAYFMDRLVDTRKNEKVLEQREAKNRTTSPSARNFEQIKRRIKKEEALAHELEDDHESTVPEVISPAPLPIPLAARTSDGVGQASNIGPSRNVETNGAASAVPTPKLSVKERRLSGEVLVQLNEKEEKSPIQALTEPETTTVNTKALEEKLVPSRLTSGLAVQRTHLSYLLRRGTVIPCGQRTRIVTDHPGFVSCVVSKDIYSADGTVLLIERGSEAFGEQRRAVLRGEASVEVLWSRIDTPNGIAIDVNSLATDALGASGIPAKVNDHAQERYGAAILLSFITDVGQALANRASSSRGAIQLNSTSNSGEGIASKALEHSIDIPPTGYSPHGAAINIFVVRDLDFRGVYDLAKL
jgi:type IV secretion system protein VirB10